MTHANDDESSLRRLRSIRLAENEIRESLDRLDRADHETGRKSTAPHYSYRIMALHLDVWQIGNSAFTPYSVPSRWLSAEGLACLFGCFVHPGTACHAKLVTLYGGWVEVDGIVRHCEHVDGNVHEVEVSFVRQIDVSMCCSNAVPCQVLLVENDQLAARMIKTWLAQHNATVRHVDNGRDAIEVAGNQKLDLVLMGIEPPIPDGISTVRAIRRKQFSCRIIAISSLDSAEVQSRALEAGCNQFLPKPFLQRDVAELLRALREEPLLSALHDDESVSDHLRAFVEELPSEISAIRTAVAADDHRALDGLIRGLRSRSAVYGFETISEATQAVLAALGAGSASAEVHARVADVLNLCARVRSPG
ncbi:MAG: response regulator [Phycisphaerae bacterium]|jgi:CheY-like chemotaxis protein